MVLPIQYRIMRDSQTKIGTKLRMMLQNIWDDPEFIAGILRDVKTDEQKQILIDEINAGENDSDAITLLAWDIKFNASHDNKKRYK